MSFHSFRKIKKELNMKTWITSIKAAVVCFAIVAASSCGQQGGLPQINGIQGPFVNMLDGKVQVTIKMLNLNVDAGIRVPIYTLRESFAELAPNVIDGGMMFTMAIDADDLKDFDIGVGDGNTLPDGRPLPGIPGGTLKDSLRIDTKIGKQDVSWYFHEQLFGVWLPFGFETAQISGYWNINISQKNVGFLGIVGNEVATGRKAGGVVLLRLQNIFSKDFQRLVRLSKRNPHILY